MKVKFHALMQLCHSGYTFTSGPLHESVTERLESCYTIIIYTQLCLSTFRSVEIVEMSTL